MLLPALWSLSGGSFAGQQLHLAFTGWKYLVTTNIYVTISFWDVTYFRSPLSLSLSFASKWNSHTYFSLFSFYILSWATKDLSFLMRCNVQNLIYILIYVLFPPSNSNKSFVICTVNRRSHRLFFRRCIHMCICWCVWWPVCQCSCPRRLPRAFTTSPVTF